MLLPGDLIVTRVEKLPLLLHLVGVRLGGCRLLAVPTVELLHGGLGWVRIAAAS
eukprot:EC787305.1.p4 GENE.EC787305.1~~EC787305.1.p4  ORF type:complete len:54 (-),score=5.89 EC787305.1:50-211(-)